MGSVFADEESIQLWDLLDVYGKYELHSVAHALCHIPALDQGRELLRAAQGLSIDKDA